jgi:hypothetical protein
MAALAPGSEVFWIAVAGIVVKVGHGEDNPTSGNWVWLSISGAAVGISLAAFAAIAGPLPNGSADRFPVSRIPQLVLSTNRHDGYGD